MIEVEIRGRLDEAGYEELKRLLGEVGEHVESHEREMFLLYDYPGYSHDPLERTADIRLRNTNGSCEIMLKQKISDNNVARREVSLKLADGDLETAKQIVKAFGCTRALKMHRVKDIYRYHNVEWSVVKAPKGYYYFEAEMEAENEDLVDDYMIRLIAEAEQLGLRVLTPSETQEFIYMLDREVNEEVEL